ncbi:MAG: GDSL-type esterase/lipase family protein [Saccharofermentanales bacterium]
MDSQTQDFFEFLFNANRNMRTEWFDFLASYARPGGVVFAGDSIMQEFCVHEMLSLPDGIQIHNRGIGGDTTSGLLGRVHNSIIALEPAIVFILIGINDMNAADYDESVSIHNIRSVLDFTSAKIPEAGIFLLSVLPTNPDVDPLTVADRSLDRIRRYNKLLKDLAGECGCIYIDLHPAFSNAKGYLREECTRDGLHLRPSGYAAMLKELMPFINIKGAVT